MVDEMNIVDFLITISLGMLGINTVFISIIYSMLPYHLKHENGQVKRWSIYPSEIIENSRISLILLFCSMLFIYAYILLNQLLVLQNQDILQAPLILLLIVSSLYIIFSIKLFYQSFIIIWNDIYKETCSQQDLLFCNVSPERMRELYTKYGISPTNELLPLITLNTITDELSFFEECDRKLETSYHICVGLSQIYGNEIPIQRIKDHLDIGNSEFNDLLAKLEKMNYIKKEGNVIKLINQFH